MADEFGNIVPADWLVTEAVPRLDQTEAFLSDSVVRVPDEVTEMEISKELIRSRAKRADSRALTAMLTGRVAQQPHCERAVERLILQEPEWCSPEHRAQAASHGSPLGEEEQRLEGEGIVSWPPNTAGHRMAVTLEGSFAVAYRRP
ncbi:hypothetical protein H920_00095 [Fukomys damarensis]|uniref:Uncharacterized protein n=1 Tax=Fukomys damarensis TaxID=885580 RepID=A0A091ERN8_FUKDA|nr:hypothetical protein H920_00095 [Fukomys damarensis]